MAVPRVSDNPPTQQQYAAQLAVTAALIGGLRALWGATLPSSSPEAMARYREGVFVLVSQWAQASASVAVDYYRSARLEAGVPGFVDVEPIPSPPRSQIDAGLDWALSRLEAEMRTQLDELTAEAISEAAVFEAQFLAEDEAQRRAEAAAQKIVTDAARDQVVAAVEGDELALGYRRVPRPDACAWCLVLAFRTSTRKGLAKDFTKYGRPGSMGEERHYGVYKSRASAGQIPPNAKGDTNRFHDNCHCVVEPVFDPVNVLPVWLHDMEALYNDSEDFNAFRRAVKARREGRDPEPPSVPVAAPSAPPTEQINALLDLLSQAA